MRVRNRFLERAGIAVQTPYSEKELCCLDEFGTLGGAMSVGESRHLSVSDDSTPLSEQGLSKTSEVPTGLMAHHLLRGAKYIDQWSNDSSSLEGLRIPPALTAVNCCSAPPRRYPARVSAITPMPPAAFSEDGIQGDMPVFVASANESVIFDQPQTSVKITDEERNEINTQMSRLVQNLKINEGKYASDIPVRVRIVKRPTEKRKEIKLSSELSRSAVLAASEMDDDSSVTIHFKTRQVQRIEDNETRQLVAYRYVNSKNGVLPEKVLEHVTGGDSPETIDTLKDVGATEVDKVVDVGDEAGEISMWDKIMNPIQKWFKDDKVDDGLQEAVQVPTTGGYPADSEALILRNETFNPYDNRYQVHGAQSAANEFYAVGDEQSFTDTRQPFYTQSGQAAIPYVQWQEQQYDHRIPYYDYHNSNQWYDGACACKEHDRAFFDWLASQYPCCAPSPDGSTQNTVESLPVTYKDESKSDEVRDQATPQVSSDGTEDETPPSKSLYHVKKKGHSSPPQKERPNIPVKIRIIKRPEPKEPLPPPRTTSLPEPVTISTLGEPVIRFRMLQTQQKKDKEKRRLITFGPLKRGPRPNELPHGNLGKFVSGSTAADLIAADGASSESLILRRTVVPPRLPRRLHQRCRSRCNASASSQSISTATTLTLPSVSDVNSWRVQQEQRIQSQSTQPSKVLLEGLSEDKQQFVCDTSTKSAVETSQPAPCDPQAPLDESEIQIGGDEGDTSATGEASTRQASTNRTTPTMADKFQEAVAGVEIYDASLEDDLSKKSRRKHPSLPLIQTDLLEKRYERAVERLSDHKPAPGVCDPLLCCKEYKGSITSRSESVHGTPSEAQMIYSVKNSNDIFNLCCPMKAKESYASSDEIRKLSERSQIISDRSLGVFTVPEAETWTTNELSVQSQEMSERTPKTGPTGAKLSSRISRPPTEREMALKELQAVVPSTQSPRSEVLSRTTTVREGPTPIDVQSAPTWASNFSPEDTQYVAPLPFDVVPVVRQEPDVVAGAMGIKPMTHSQVACAVSQPLYIAYTYPVQDVSTKIAHVTAPQQSPLPVMPLEYSIPDKKKIGRNSCCLSCCS